MTTLEETYAALRVLAGNTYSTPWSYARYELDRARSASGLSLTTVATGGGENQGSAAFVVIEVIDALGGIQYFRKDGFYASYDGYTWDGDFYEVVPQEKTITVYEDSVGVRMSAYDEPDYDSFDSYGD